MDAAEGLSGAGAIVRVQMRRLHAKLKDYYPDEGSADPIVVYA
jgi:hypothetical protein